MFSPLDFENVSQYQRTTLLEKRVGKGWPKGVKLVKLIGKGSNNTVYLAKKGDVDIAVRVPRTNSDTQSIENATWEFRNSMIAAQVSAAPIVYDAWYNRHATSQQRSGLHMITEYFPYDVHKLLMENSAAFLHNSEQLCAITITHLRSMSQANILCYDLKPSNMVLRLDPFDVKFVDFGREFTEWRPYQERDSHVERAPVLSFLQKLVDGSNLATDEMTNEMIYNDIIFHVMLILLSSNLEYTIQQSSTVIRSSSTRRQFMNFLFDYCRQLRQCSKPDFIDLIQAVLRHSDIRNTVRHYTGRRNCGTKRTFMYAGFGPFASQEI